MKTEGSYLKLYPLPNEMVEIINEDLRGSLHHLLDKGTDVEGGDYTHSRKIEWLS